MTRHDARRVRAAALAGAAGSVGFLVVAFGVSLWRGDVDPYRHFLSELALGPGGHLVMAALVVNGLGLLVLGGAIRNTLAPSRPQSALLALIVVGGIGIVLAGIFPTDARGAQHTEIGFTHGIVAGVALSALVGAALLFAAAVRLDPRWHRSRDLAAGFAALVTCAYLVYMGMFVGHWIDLFAADDFIGAAQRAAVTAGLLWVLVVATLTWHHAGPAPTVRARTATGVLGVKG